MGKRTQNLSPINITITPEIDGFMQDLRAMKTDPKMIGLVAEVTRMCEERDKENRKTDLTTKQK